MSKHVANKQPFIEHVQELRRRLFWWALSLLAGAGIGYWLQAPIQSFLIAPLNQPLFYTSPTGGFDFLIRLCLFFGMLLSVPIFTYHLLRFIEPSLGLRTRFLIVKLLLSSLALALIGASFAYFISMPAALRFLGDFGNDHIKSLISTDAYLHFVMVYIAGYAALFQLPLILLFINRVKPMPPKKLMKQQRWVILGSFVIAAILTPTPDPMNQAIMAGPMIALYEVSIALIWVVNRQRKLPANEALPVASGWLRRIFIKTTLPAPQPLSPAMRLQTLDTEPVDKSAWVVNLIDSAPIASPTPTLASRPAIVASQAPRPMPEQERSIDLKQFAQKPYYKPSKNIIDMRPAGDAASA